MREYLWLLVLIPLGGCGCGFMRASIEVRLVEGGRFCTMQPLPGRWNTKVGPGVFSDVGTEGDYFLDAGVVVDKPGAKRDEVSIALLLGSGFQPNHPDTKTEWLSNTFLLPLADISKMREVNRSIGSRVASLDGGLLNSGERNSKAWGEFARHDGHLSLRTPSREYRVSGDLPLDIYGSADGKYAVLQSFVRGFNYGGTVYLEIFEISSGVKLATITADYRRLAGPLLALKNTGWISNRDHLVVGGSLLNVVIACRFPE